MKPCKNCYENHWSTQRIDGYIRATCQMCGYEVEFMSREGLRELREARGAKLVEKAKKGLKTGLRKGSFNQFK